MNTITKNSTVTVGFLLKRLSETISFGQECMTAETYTLRFCKNGKSCSLTERKGKKNGCMLWFDFEEGCEKDISLKLGNHELLLLNSSEHIIGRQPVLVQKRFFTITYHY